MSDMRMMAEKLALAREFVATDPLDVGAALAFLDGLPPVIGERGHDVIAAARQAVSDVQEGDGRHQSIARYAIARIVVVLERTVMDDAS